MAIERKLDSSQLAEPNTQRQLLKAVTVLQTQLNSPEISQISQREQIDKYSHIVVISNQHGIGDSIMELPYIIGLAQAFSEKEFSVLTHSAIPTELLKSFSNLNYLPSPQPFSFHVDQKKTLVLTLSEYFKDNYYTLRSVFLPRLDHSTARAFNTLTIDNFSDHASVFGTQSLRMLMNLIQMNTLSQVNKRELLFLSRVLLFGRPIPLSDDIFKLDVLDSSSDNIDMLYLPDAREVSNGYQSLKSPTPSQHIETLRELSKDHEVTFLSGISHRRFCQDIYKRATKFGVKLAKTKSLLELAGLYWRTKTFVGVDSGTTHLAAKMTRTFQKHGHPLKVRELFHSERLSSVEYGASGQLTDVSIQVTQETLSTLPMRSTFDPREFAEFVRS